MAFVQHTFWRTVTSTFTEKAEAWDKAVAGIKPPGPDSSMGIVTEALEKELDRAIAAIATNDSKAALVIPGIGALAAIVGSNVRPDLTSHPLLAVLGFGAAVGAVIALFCAFLAIRPQSYSHGPLPNLAVLAVREPEEVGKLNYVKSLGFACYAAQDVVRSKALWIEMALLAGAIGVMLLTAFTAAGGFAAEGMAT